MIRYFVAILLVCVVLEASIVQVVKASKDVAYKEILSGKNLYIANIDTNQLNRYCNPIIPQDIAKGAYRSKRYLKKGEIVCLKGIYKTKIQEKIIFNFGNIEIEKDGKVIKNTKTYVKILDGHGKIQNIYKDGRPR